MRGVRKQETRTQRIEIAKWKAELKSTTREVPAAQPAFRIPNLIDSNGTYAHMIERAYYQNKISAFLERSPDVILGELARKNQFPLEVQQRNAWLAQIDNLREQLRDFQDGEIFFEFAIPRMGKRVDVLLLIAGVIWVIEYKVGARIHDRYAIDQTMDYALDLKNFHQGSHDKYIVSGKPAGGA